MMNWQRQIHIQIPVVLEGQVANGVDWQQLQLKRDDQKQVLLQLHYFKRLYPNDEKSWQTDLKQMRQFVSVIMAQPRHAELAMVGVAPGDASEYFGARVQTAEWWRDFWRMLQTSSNYSKREAHQKIKAYLGRDYAAKPVNTLFLKDILRTHEPAKAYVH